MLLFLDVTCNFRGCKLNGLKITLPESYKGIILHESIKPITEKQDRKFYVTNHFDNVTYWNWDKKTSKNDAIQQALDWVDIAEAVSWTLTNYLIFYTYKFFFNFQLHSPITEE